jgi:Fe2+ or Zn2+ uptake regulation protein
MKNTPQRAEILKYLEGNKSHPRALDIYKHVKKKFKNISFATVYNNIEILNSLGKIIELDIDPSAKRYDPDTSQHDHIICPVCKTIFDIKAIKSKIKIKKFKVLSYSTSIKAICPKCLKKQRRKKCKK